MTEVADPSTARFLHTAKLCRTRDLQRLFILGELVKSISELIHALQKERGASSIVLGSSGASFKTHLAAQVAESSRLEEPVRERLAHIDEKIDKMSFGARFYTRGAHAFHALDALVKLRAQIEALSLAPQDGVKAYSDIIGCLLAVGFEVADIAADPEISRALVALANFAQGKEYAGQERATAGAAFSRGRFEVSDQDRLRQLIAAQDQAFRVFCEFAAPERTEAFRSVVCGSATAEVKRMRKMALAREPSDEIAGPAAVAWFEHTTRRIDTLRKIEEQLTSDLSRLCTAKLAETREHTPATEDALMEASDVAASIAMAVTDANPALNTLGVNAGVGLFTLAASLPKPMHSILDVVQAQSRQLSDVSHQLESARAALSERKAIERAKGLLMTSRRLSEKDAYSLMREIAMSQNKRIAEIAEAIVSMAGIL